MLTCEKRYSDSSRDCEAKNKNSHSTFEASSDTKEDIRIDSQDQEDEETNSDQEDMVYAPNPFQGDGRKREAKRHKSKIVVAQDEIDLDQMIRDHQNENVKIVELEDMLDNLKSQKISKKELQSQRNRLTAQLSRDRQKLEMNFLKAMCVNYQRLLRKLDRKLADKESFCPKCRQNLTNTMMHHKNNQANPSQFAEQPIQQNFEASKSAKN